MSFDESIDCNMRAATVALPMRMIILAAIAIVLLGGVLWWILRDRPLKWIVYYGSAISAEQVRGLDLAILEPDHIIPVDLPFVAKDHPIFAARDGLATTRPELGRRQGPIFVAYLSVGEIHESRYYWQEHRSASWVVEENPDWPGAHRVDIRSEEWQILLLDDIIPSLLAKGYEGLFLDTVDSAIYLEETYPERFPGSKLAMVKFIRALRDRYPHLIILPNNGFTLLDRYATVIDGIVVEDLYTRYDFAAVARDPKAPPYIKTPKADTAYKERLLAPVKKPVFNILYAESRAHPVARYGIAQSQKKGFHWYLATIDLKTIGQTD
jgi:polysaccharide biosynthesis protein PelA